MNKVSPYLQGLLANHQYQGRSNDCGSFCAAAVMNLFHHSERSGFDIGRAMEKVRWRNGFMPVIRRIKNWATFPWGVRDLLRENGFQAKWLVFQKRDDLIRMLSEGSILIVIIGNFFPTWAHYKILGAYNPARGYGFVDSAYKNKALHWDSIDYFEKHWKKYGSQVIQVFPGSQRLAEGIEHPSTSGAE